MVFPLLSIVHLVLVLNRLVVVVKTIFWPGSSQIQTRSERYAFNVCNLLLLINHVIYYINVLF